MIDFIKKAAEKMNKPFSDNLLNEPLMSLNVGYTAIEVLILIKTIADLLDIGFIDLLDSFAGNEITYNSINICATLKLGNISNQIPTSNS